MIFFRYIIIPFIFFQTIEKSNYLEKIPDSNYSIDMVYIPAGEYKMGNDDKNSNTKISSFWISKYEITWEVFNLFMEYENDYKYHQVTYKSTTIFVFQFLLCQSYHLHMKIEQFYFYYF